MSRALSIANQMAKEARDLPALADSTVIVFRQQNINDQVADALAKATGAAVVIGKGGISRAEDTEQILGPRVTQSFIVALYYAPVLTEGGTPIDDVEEALLTYFDHWVPTRNPTSRDVWMRYRGSSDPEDDELGFSYIEMTFDITIQHTSDHS